MAIQNHLFAKLIDITRPTLDRLLLGEIDSLTKFKQYVNKVIETQEMDEERLLNYTQKIKTSTEPVLFTLIMHQMGI